MKTPLFASVALLAILPMVASAQVVPGQNFMMMWDADGDGVVTRAEAEARRGDMFYAFDADENETLDLDELTEMDTSRDLTQQGQERPQNAPKGQGLQGQPGQRGQSACDAACSHDQPAFGQGPNSGQGPRGMAQGGMGQGAMGQGGKGGGYRAQMPQPKGGQMQRQTAMNDHAAMDLDGDGMVSRAEFESSAIDWFARMDRNGDGVLTSADFGR